jgi:hypothetical protein
VALHDRPPVTRQLHYNPHLQFGTAYETWRQGVLAQRFPDDSASYAQSPARSPAVAHNARADTDRDVTDRFDFRRESALSPYAARRHISPALAAHADMVMAGSGPDPAGGHPRRSRKVSLPFGNAACTGQSGAETVIPLQAAASDASLKL